jgi:hypothetical protein
VPKINGRIKGRVKVVQELHQYEEIFIWSHFQSM